MVPRTVAGDMDSNGSVCPARNKMLKVGFYHIMNVIVTETYGADRVAIGGK